MNAIPKLPKQGRIKDKYRPNPSPREKQFHFWLMEHFPCACGCGKRSTVVHHPLQEHPDQGTRRNHEYVVPMDGFCHMELHAAGSEEAFTPGRDYAGLAAMYRQMAYQDGVL